MLRFHQEHLASAEERKQQRAHRRRAIWPEAYPAPTPPPAPIPADTAATETRAGYARCPHLTQELQAQLDALEAHGTGRDTIFAEKVSTRVRVRPKFEAALELCRQRVRDRVPSRDRFVPPT